MLAASTSDQVIPAPGAPWTSHFVSPGFGGTILSSRAAAAVQGARTAPGSAYSLLAPSSLCSSTLPVIVYVCSGPLSVVREPMRSPVDSRKCSVATTSSLPAGYVPSTRSSLPRTAGSEVRSSTISMLAMPCRVVTVAGTDCSVMYREPSGKALRTSTGFGALSGCGAPGGEP